jgi:hypothetical protein
MRVLGNRTQNAASYQTTRTHVRTKIFALFTQPDLLHHIPCSLSYKLGRLGWLLNIAPKLD